MATTRKKRTRKKRARDFRPRTARQRQVFDKVLAALSLSRREGIDLPTAAAIEGTNLRTVRRHVPSALEKRKGKYRAKPFDRLPRTLTVIGSKGMVTHTVRSSRSASTIARYLNAVRKFLRDKNPSALAEYRNKKISGYKFVTDLDLLRRLGDAGLLALDRLYAGVTHGR